MQKLLKQNWIRSLFFLALVCALVGCTAEAKRARHMKRADAYFKQKEYPKAELEYRNAARLTKEPDPHLVSQMALLFYEQGRLIDAFPVLKKAVSLKPDDLDLQYKLGAVWATFRSYTNARDAALLVLAKNPSHHEAKLLLADSAQNPEEIAVARQKLNEILKTNGESWSVHVALAELALREKDLDLAEKEVELAAKLDAKASQINLARAQLASLRQQPKEVERLLPAVSESSPARSPQRLLLAQSKMQGTNVAEAKTLVDALLKEVPDYVPAWVLRAQIAMAEKDYAEVSRIAQKVLSWDANSYELRLLNARALALQQQPAKALEEFQRLEKMNPKSANLKYEFAAAHVQDGALNEAMRKLDEALRINPDYTDAVIVQSELKLRTGAAKEATESLEAFAKQHPETGRIRVVLANAYSRVGKLDEALAIYREFIRANPSVPGFWYSAGEILRYQKKFDEARASFEEALKRAPGFLLAAEQIVDLDMRKKDFDAAQLRINEQLKLTTNAPGALMLQVKLCFAKRDWAGAESALTQVIQAEPNAMAPYSLLANVYLSKGDPKKALAQLQSAVDRNPKDTTAPMLMASIYSATKEYDKAKAAYENVLKLNPKLPAALNDFAYLLSERLNQVDQALPYATKARELAPNDPAVEDTLGWILYRRGNTARALPLLRESAEKFATTPNDQPEVQYHLAMVHYTMGDEAAARTSFARVIELNKPFSEEKGVQRRVAVLDLDVAKPNAVEVLESALKEDSNDYFAALKLGQAYERAGANEKARIALERVARMRPTSSEPLLLLASLNVEKLNDVPKALEAGRAARKLAPNDAAIAGVFGRISFRAGDYATALALLQEYAKSDQAGAESLFDLALSRYSVGQVDEARANLRDYTAAARGARIADAKGLIVLMDFHTGRGEARQAEAIAVARLQRDRNDIPGLMTLGLIADRNQKYPDAAEKFERVAAMTNLFPVAQRQLAIFYAGHLQNDQRAYDFGTSARKTFGSDADLAIALGKTMYRRGDFQNATRLLTEGVRERQSDPEAFFFLGMAQYKLGKLSDAKIQVKRALDLKLDSRLAAEAQAVLAE